MSLSLGTSTSDSSNQQFEKFRSLPGPEKVAVVFNERFHGRSLLFWRRSAEIWRTPADARQAWEEMTLVVSLDPAINDALATEIRSPNVERARYAVFLACLRARFVPASEFTVKQIEGAYTDGVRSGDISPFRPNMDMLGVKANNALEEAIRSPDPKLRTTTKLYTFTWLDELSTVPTIDVVNRWRKELSKISCFSYVPVAFLEPAQSVFLLERTIASRGIEAVNAISFLLRIEKDPTLRHYEIEMLQFLDVAVVRLRRSQDGKEAISVVQNAFLRDQEYCGQHLYETAESRRKSWHLLEDQFFSDKFDSGLGSWATLVAVALDQEYGDHFSVPFEKSVRISGQRFQQFLSDMTELDPTFPGWEFPSTGTQGDMLHPAFGAKIRRYQEALAKIPNPRNHSE